MSYLASRPLCTGVYLLAVAVSAMGCTGAGDTSGVPDQCLDNIGRPFTPCRVFRGRIKLPPANRLPIQQQPFQVAAVAFEAGAGGGGDAGTPALEPRFFFGNPFAQEAGAGQRASVPFSIVLPCRLSVNLLLQIPDTPGGSAPGVQVAPMKFARDDTGSLTTLIPPPIGDLCAGDAKDIDLEEITLVLAKGAALTEGTITLGTEKSRNPLDIIDTDGDGQVDLADSDDDNDGVVDVSDTDANGDTLEDQKQMLSALPDVDGNGIPDMFQ
jgi:hypothetical protein